VIAGGVAVLSGIFDELELDEMTVAVGALRDGVLWDLLGRVHHRDIREVTVEQFARRYHVDGAQAQRVAGLAQALRKQLAADDEALEGHADFLEWGAKLHEIGMSIAQGAYHKHSAYILANADMPGFSRQEQGWLSNLVLAQRGKLAKMRAALDDDPRLAALAFCLRLAVIFQRSRRSLKLPRIEVARKGREWRFQADPEWLRAHSLIDVALEHEKEEWESVGWELEVADSGAG
jgi:exopolyphosphatase/guanosine-5'-triphosphate,3'-diphosphate pyrophosphatase